MSMIQLERELDSDERKILELLYPNEVLWLRVFAYKLAHRSTTTVNKALIALEKKGYIKNDKKPNWRRGQKINFKLTIEGKRAAERMMIGERAKHLLIGILEKLRLLTMKPGGGGDEEIQIALDIYNYLDTPEAGEAIKNIVEKNLKRLGKKN